MPDAKVTSKGQITIPKPVRLEMGLNTGDQVEFIADGNRMVLQKKVTNSPFKKYRGYLKHLKGSSPDAIIEDIRGK